MVETIDLSYPVDLNGKQIGKVTMRRPTVADLVAAQDGSRSQMEQELKLIAALTDQAPTFVEKLDMKDYVSLQKKLQEIIDA